jgi:uncharacterized protein
MRRRLLAAVLAAAASLALPAAAPAASTTIVISELRTHGPAGGNDEFVELRNISSAPIDVGGWQLQGCAAASGAPSTRATVPAGTTIPAGGSYLFTNTAANGYSGSVPGDATYGVGISDDGGVRIENAGIAVDGVGKQDAGPDQCREGTGLNFPTADADNGFERAGGNQDTDDNATDFTGPKPSNPQNSGSAPSSDAAPAVASSDPANGQSGVDPGSSISVTFSERVTTAADAFALACSDGRSYAVSVSSSDQVTYTVDAGESLPRASCTLTVRGASVSDVDPQDPPDAMAQDRLITFLVAGVEGLRIHDIQGGQHRSPREGETVAGVPGVVTAVSSNGFWMQDPQPDGDRRTSEGIFVFRGGRPAIGIGVTVGGLVEEFRPGGDPNNLTTTEISNPTVTPGGTGSIAPTLLGGGGLEPPLRIIDNDSSGDVELNPVFDPWQDGIDFHESLEGMLVEIRRPVAVGPTNGFDELPVVSVGAAEPRSERDGVIVRPNDFNPERFILDDVIADPPDAHVGDGLQGPVRAVVDYSFANFKYLLTSSPARIDNGLEREVTQAPRRDELSTGSMNVENLTFADVDDSKFERLARILVENMRSPDIVAVEEIQDNDGAANTPVTDASLTYQRFIAKIAEVGGPAYEFRQIDPVDDQDGGQPGGNIRVGFLFRTDRGLAFVDRPGGTSVNSTEVVDGASGPELTFSPGRLDPTNPAFLNSRKPLAGEFRWRGETVIAVANHFNSKGGDQPLFGRFQPPERVTEAQRHQQAEVVRAFVDQALDVDRDARVIVMGDLNDFEFSRTLDILESAPMFNLMETLDRDERYSYVFEGNSQTLDQILVTRALRRRAEYDSVHVNAEFFDQASDHDPQVARLRVDDDSDDDS